MNKFATPQYRRADGQRALPERLISVILALMAPKRNTDGPIRVLQVLRKCCVSVALGSVSVKIALASVNLTLISVNLTLISVILTLISVILTLMAPKRNTYGPIRVVQVLRKCCVSVA